jgi:hypothetical protein
LAYSASCISVFQNGAAGRVSIRCTMIYYRVIHVNASQRSTFGAPRLKKPISKQFPNLPYHESAIRDPEAAFSSAIYFYPQIVTAVANLPKTMFVTTFACYLRAPLSFYSTSENSLETSSNRRCHNVMLMSHGLDIGHLSSECLAKTSQLMWSRSQEGAEVLEARRLCSRRSPSAHNA